MWSILIVDDEYYAREGLQRILELHGGEEYELIGMAEDAVSALEIIEQRRPSIVLADIQMPVMSGLELARLGQGSGTRFIIVSGHNDFTYAKEAVRLEAVDYILKPVNPEELMRALGRAVDALSRDNNAIRQRIIAYLRRQTTDVKLLSRLPYRQFQLVLFELEAVTSREETDFTLATNYLRERLGAFTGEPCSLLHLHSDRIVLLADSDGSTTLFLQDVQREIMQQFGLQSSVALPPLCDAAGLPDAYSAAKELLTGRFYLGGGRIITALPQPTRLFSTDDLERATLQVHRSISARNTRKALSQLDELFSLLRETQPSRDAVLPCAMSLYLSLQTLLKEERIYDPLFENYNPARHIFSLNRLYQVMTAMVEEGLDALRDKQGVSEDSAVEKAVKIIRERYCEDLSLERLAGEVFLNPSYLSRKLKEKLGMTFSKYITTLRMEKAQEILQRTGSVEQAAREVGYSNYRYFSELFKQHTGFLPSRYMKH